ncbi:spore germination protein GerPC [Bacillus suaedaesalsae]|uniref:Spore gernimation protein GerPC n=1 Tax=Bacillus suaedaesalsae TaxID=2810349 RepID=A0ABS2DF99_9BACI|nr:spore germination protein GerPC [Bacillus suaedaesalsae]MBM6617133.1 spore gernimation protein GerPC [Bacillus suaedaesalsae]
MYYQNFDLTNYIYQLQQQIQSQQIEIQKMQTSLASVQSEIKELKKKPSTTIEKIEYKFDQLKVETLEGTLNIGLNPYNEEQIEDFDVTQGKLKVPGATAFSPDIQSTIRNSILNYLDHEGFAAIQSLEKRSGAKLNEAHYEFMIQDVKRQLDTRIMYYLEQTTPQQWENENRTLETTNQILEKMKEDINGAFLAFIQHLPQNWEG